MVAILQNGIVGDFKVVIWVNLCVTVVGNGYKGDFEYFSNKQTWSSLGHSNSQELYAPNDSQKSAHYLGPK